MSETLFLARLRAQEAVLGQIDEFYRNQGKGLRELPGLRGSGLWRQVSDPTQNLILVEFESDEAARQTMIQVAEQRAFAALEAHVSEPVDALAFRILQSEGALRGHLDQAEYLSISLRVSEPGYPDILTTDLERVFAELRYIEGYCGSLVAQNQALQEEILGLVAWGSEEAFAVSLPRTTTYEVRLYRKVS